MTSTLNWHAGAGWQTEDQFFSKAVIAGLLVLLLLSIAVPLYQVPERSRQQLEQLPPQLARVMLEEREITPPEPIELPEPEPIPEPEPEPEQQVVEASPVTQEQARAQAQQAGLLAMQDELAALRQTFTVNQQAPQLQRDGQQSAATPEPELIANPALAKTAAKAAAPVSADVARADLNQAESITLADGELRGLASAAPTRNTGNAGNDPAAQGGRSEASIRQTLEANKSSLYTLYNRALRANPLLKGKVVFELIINPDGSLAQVKIIESELNDERLERQLQLRLQSVNFGAADVSPTRSQWTIAFLPG